MYRTFMFRISFTPPSEVSEAVLLEALEFVNEHACMMCHVIWALCFQSRGSLTGAAKVYHETDRVMADFDQALELKHKGGRGEPQRMQALGGLRQGEPPRSGKPELGRAHAAIVRESSSELRQRA